MSSIIVERELKITGYQTVTLPEGAYKVLDIQVKDGAIVVLWVMVNEDTPYNYYLDIHCVGTDTPTNICAAGYTATVQMPDGSAWHFFCEYRLR